MITVMKRALPGDLSRDIRRGRALRSGGRTDDRSGAIMAAARLRRGSALRGPAPAQGSVEWFEYPPAVRGLGVLHCIVGFVEFVVMIIAYSSLACWPGRTESCAAAIHQSWSFIFFFIIGGWVSGKPRYNKTDNERKWELSLIHI